MLYLLISSSFFLNDSPTTEIYTLSLHDALPIFLYGCFPEGGRRRQGGGNVAALGAILALPWDGGGLVTLFQRSEEHTLNSSHANISYAVFCLKKKKKHKNCHNQAQQHTHHTQLR